MEPYFCIAWTIGAVGFPFAATVTLVGVNELDRACARIGLACMAACIMAPLAIVTVLPVLAAVGLMKAVRVADLPALLPGPKEQTPGQLSIAAKQGGEVSRVDR